MKYGVEYVSEPIWSIKMLGPTLYIIRTSTFYKQKYE